jgi:hypothetical protein
VTSSPAAAGRTPGLRSWVEDGTVKHTHASMQMHFQNPDQASDATPENYNDWCTHCKIDKQLRLKDRPRYL